MGELTKPGEVLAVAVNFVHTIGDGQQLSFGTAFAIDMSRGEKVKILDELADLSARQAARAKRPSILADIRKHRETLAQFQEDAGRAELAWPAEAERLDADVAAAEDEAAHKVKLDALRKEIAESLDELRGRRTKEYNEGLAEFRGAGRVADYKPKGFRATNLDRMDASLRTAEETAGKMLEQLEYDRIVAIDAAKAARTKAEAERQVVVGNYDVSINRYNQAIAGLEEQLAEVDALLED